ERHVGSTMNGMAPRRSARGNMCALRSALTALSAPAFALVVGACGLGLVGERASGDAGATDGGPLFDVGSLDGATSPPVSPRGLPYLRYAGTTAPPTVDLTAEGMLDWAKWGDQPGAGAVRKLSGGNLIGDFTVGGTAIVASNSTSGSWPIVTK